MDFLRPASLAEALEVRAARPEALPVAGGTDVMVGMNFARSRPAALLDLGRVPELTGCERHDGELRLGAGMTYAELTGERAAGPGRLTGDHAAGGAASLRRLLPGLAMAARTVGSPQIRNRGTIGGNLGTASPAGDCHPSLLAAGAEIEVASVSGSRRIPAAGFFLGPKRNALAPDELITAIWIRPAPGPEQFAKIGTRNAMVIAVASFALALFPDRQRAGTGIGSAGPTPLAATDAEEFLAGALAEASLWESRGALPEALVTEFGARVSAAARPIDDVRSTAAYRGHGLAVLARRTLTWAWRDYQGTGVSG